MPRVMVVHPHISPQPIVTLGLLRCQDFRHFKVRLEVDGTQAGLLSCRHGGLRVDAVVAHLLQRKEPVEVGFRRDQRFTCRNGILAHLLERLLRPRFLVCIKTKLLRQFQHVHRARIAVEFCRKRIAKASTAPQAFLPIGGQCFHIARLETDIG